MSGKANCTVDHKPYSEIEKGLFPHGGIRLVKSYLNENDQPTIKAKAIKVHISELAKNGKPNDAIKVCREVTGLGLKEAKRVIEYKLYY